MSIGSAFPGAAFMNTRFHRTTVNLVLMTLSAVVLTIIPRSLLGQRGGGNGGGVYKARLTPHLYEGNTKFWYQNDLADGKREFIVGDVERGKREEVPEPPKIADVPTSLHLSVDGPRRSRSGGDETELTFANRSGSE